jgi:hypothetical protein
MQKHDLPALANSLNGLAEVFDRKAVTPKALEVWFETLREFYTERVAGLLTAWPKTHSKFPTPAEVWKVLNDFNVEERERTAKAEKTSVRRDYEHLARTPRGEECLVLISGALAGHKPTPIEHWRNVMATVGLHWISYEYATAALKRLVREPAREREPGEDAEEDEVAPSCST